MKKRTILYISLVIAVVLLSAVTVQAIGNDSEPAVEAEQPAVGAKETVLLEEPVLQETSSQESEPEQPEEEPIPEEDPYDWIQGVGEYIRSGYDCETIFGVYDPLLVEEIKKADADQLLQIDVCLSTFWGAPADYNEYCENAFLTEQEIVLRGIHAMPYEEEAMPYYLSYVEEAGDAWHIHDAWATVSRFYRGKREQLLLETGEKMDQLFHVNLGLEYMLHAQDALKDEWMKRLVISCMDESNGDPEERVVIFENTGYLRAKVTVSELRAMAESPWVAPELGATFRLTGNRALTRKIVLTPEDFPQYFS